VVAVVVQDALVVVVLALPVEPALLVAHLVMLVAVQPLVLQGEAVPRYELLLALYAFETV
jgi:hypothetical protein